MLLFYMALIDAEEDKLTFEHIFTQYPKQMHKVAFRILKNEHSAEDAVQEAFLGLAKSIHRVPTGNERVTRAYVLTAARNAALALLAKEQRWRACGEIDRLPIRSNPAVFEQILCAESRERLKNALLQLPLKYREVLMLRYVMELKPKEIASTLHRKTTTVQQQLSRGKKLLETIYKKEALHNGK